MVTINCYRHRYVSMRTIALISSTVAWLCSPTSTYADETWVKTCDESTKSQNPNYDEDAKWCQQYADTSLIYPVCGFANGKLTTFENRECAQCNQLTNYRNGTCDDSGPQYQPEKTTIATCPVTASKDEKYECHKLVNVEPTCVDGTDYFNLDCALCHGVNRSKVSFGSCANPEKLVGTCINPNSTSSFRNKNCLLGSPSPICSKGKSYRNIECGLCNNVGYDWVTGTCLSKHPCSSSECPDNAHCTMSVFDCDFDNNFLCGWTAVGNTATIVANANGPVKDVGGPHSLLLSQSFVTSPSYNAASLQDNVGGSGTGQCSVKFLVSDDNHESLKLTLTVNGAQSSDIWNGVNTYTSSNGAYWAEQTVALTTLKFLDNSANFSLTFTSNADQSVKVDNVRLLCEEEHSGDCACDAGYTTIYDDGSDDETQDMRPSVKSCEPSLAKSIEFHANASGYSLTTFWTYLQKSPTWKAKLMNSSQVWQDTSAPQPNWVVFAPTDSALAALPLTTDPDALIASHVIGPLTAYPQRQLFVDNYNKGSRNLTWLGSRGDLGAAIPYDFQTYDLEKMTFGAGGTAKELVELTTTNGIIYVVSGLVSTSGVAPGNNVCGSRTCGANAVCRGIPAERGDMDAFYPIISNSMCPLCSKYIDTQSRKNEVCTTNGSSYRDSCWALCQNATVVLEGTSCPVPKCVCQPGYEAVGNPVDFQYTTDQGCSPLPPTPPATCPPTQAEAVVPERTVYDFFVNGSFYDLVQTRAMMMDGVFSESMRNVLGRVLALTSEEWGNFELDVHPSARMPGYILVKIADYNTEVIAKMRNAVEQGKIQMKWYNSSNPSQRWFLQGFPMKNLPPVVKYSFLVDVNYGYDETTDTAGVICKQQTANDCTPKTSFRGCFNEVVNQESFIFDSLIWTLQNTHSLSGFGDTSKLHMWPHRSVRNNSFGKIEVVATALEMYSDVLVNLRNYIEDGKLSKIMIMVTNTDNLNGNVKPISDVLSGDPKSAGRGGSSQLTYQAEIGDYPGSSLTGAMGSVTVEEGAEEKQLRVVFTLIVPQSFETGGIHIHSGTSCALSWKVGGHYYSTKVDPWNSTWSSQADGSSTGAFTITSGYGLSANENHTVVIHDSKGRRIGCGVLTRPNWKRVTLNNNTITPTKPSQTTSSDADGVAGVPVGTMVAVVLVLGIILAGLAMYFHVTKKQIAEEERRKKKKGSRNGHTQFSNSGFDNGDVEDGAVTTTTTTTNNNDDTTDMTDKNMDEANGTINMSGYMDVEAYTDDVDVESSDVSTKSATNPFV